MMTSWWHHNDVIRGWDENIPDRDCKFPSIQFRHHQGTCNLQHKNPENHKFHDKDISLLSSLSAHNLEKTVFKSAKIMLTNLKVNILSDFELAKAKIGEIPNGFEYKQSTTSSYTLSINVFFKSYIFEMFFGNTIIQHAIFILIYLLSFLNILVCMFNPGLTYESYNIAHYLRLILPYLLYRHLPWIHHDFEFDLMSHEK